MKSVVQKFYIAFNNLDADAMIKYYDENVIFEDPAFGKLEGSRAANMWRMLCTAQEGKDFRVECSDIKENGNQVTARWDAYYTFTPTGRKVHNIIFATFTFENEKIIKHSDHFDLYRWSRQAMGWKGLLMGWTPFFKSKLHQNTNRLLDKFSTNRN